MSDPPIGSPETSAVPFHGPNCPVPLTDYPRIVPGHGGGGVLSAELVEQIFLPAFCRPGESGALRDSAVFSAHGGRLAFSTDSHVVRPLFFPGGSIGHLAVNGTVNDLAMSGADPIHLSAAFILEEGFSTADLKRIADDMGAAAEKAGVRIITGDTKVVDRGHGDGCYISTAGIGIVPDGIDIAPDRAVPGDAVIVSGTIGDHGMAVMSVREGLEFDAEIVSDCAPLNDMVSAMISECPDIHVLRDPTRGGLAASLNEIASASRCGIVLEETRLPVNDTVQSACEMLGLDPLLVACEGRLVCITPADTADALIQVMQSFEQGSRAAVVGTVVSDHAGMVVGRTAIGATRVITLPIGEQLPRIC